MQYNPSKLIELIQSGIEENIDLAFQLAEGQKIDLSDFFAELQTLFPNRRRALNRFEIKMLFLVDRYDWSQRNQGRSIAAMPSRNLDLLPKPNKGLLYLPKAIGLFRQLKELNLAQNSLMELPAEIGRLTQLNTLNLSNNILRTLAPEIGQLQNLRNLYLNNNKLTNLPVQITQLQHLKTLTVGDNKLSKGSIEEVRKALPNTDIY